MAFNNAQDNEFDPEMERILQEHFDAEASDLQSPGDPWQWLESHMEEPAPPSFFSRLLGGLNPLREFRVSPALAGAAVAVVAVAVVATVWAVSGNGDPGSSGGMASLTPADPPASTARPTAIAMGGAQATENASASQLSDPNPTYAGPATISVPTPLPLATTVPQVAMEESEAVVEEAASDTQRAAVPTPAAYATQVPAAQATTAPVMAATQAHAGARAPRTEAGPAGPIGPAGTAGPPADTTFRDYQRQPFVAASEDNVSTFSLDTDRTSFQLALNWARSGYVIDPDSVRAEEWLNAFNYDYDLPLSDSMFAVTSDLYPHPLDERLALARVTFQAPELVVDRPLNVTLVLDASGSMADGNRVDIARQAAESIRQSLRPNDLISVVHFTEQVIDRYTVEHTHPGDDRAVSSIGWLQPHGSTNVQAGLNLGVQLAARARDLRPDAYNYVILMSDGVANVDATDPFAILETAYDPDATNPLRLITIGVGINNYNDPLLEQLAQHGNGWYRYLDSPEQAQATFTRENWLSLSTPFADQTRAQVTWDAGAVEQWRIVGYENRVTAAENFAQDRKEFAEIYSGAATTVLYELKLADSVPSPGSIPLGTVELRWLDPATGDARSQVVALSGDAASDFGGRDGSLAHFGAIVALAADLYGGLFSGYDAVSENVYSGLVALGEELHSLDGDLGSLDSYRDFRLVLEHIIGSVEEQLPPSVRSGYSR